MIRAIIAEAVLNSTALVMKYGDKGWQNLFGDELETTAVYLNGPTVFKIPNTLNMAEKYTVTMLFLQKSELDFSPEQQDVATEVPRQLLRAFVQYCRAHQGIQLFEMVEAIEVWNILDSNASGWALICNITPEPTEAVC